MYIFKYTFQCILFNVNNKKYVFNKLKMFLIDLKLFYSLKTPAN